MKELKLLSRGKVRDIYDFENNLLIITTDRVSAFDHILNQTVPYKGIILNQISLFFFQMTKDIIDNHIIHGDFELLPDFLKKYEYLKGRFIIAKKAKPLPIECIIRGYITGSGWKEYSKEHSIGGMFINEELIESEKFDKPLFTPSTKAEHGHDENISFDDMKKIVDPELANLLKEKTEQIFTKCSDFALKKNIIIADTKMEFGLLDNKLIIIDELLTPDSSRFWNKNKYEKGRKQESYDKQFIRNYLLESKWDLESSPPDIPDSIIQETSIIYKNIFKELTGNEIS
ncbi:phosphoribosylaminoimidazolesuccinocarboxamide synthase [candidate division WOR-3 bacterium]|nr:phosphoribosylaminoimidazolesuccinocarboxamide synthase [candidate division WOR-3 bacterium]